MSRTAPIRVAVIVGSIREGRFSPTPAEWFVGNAQRHHDVEVDLIDLAHAGLPAVMVEDDADMPAEARVMSERLTLADAFVVVTGEYNRSFPASLKSAIDWFHDEWQTKPVGFVSYGGVSAGLGAVEQLRQVFTELHATTVRGAVCFPNFWDLFDADGNWPKDRKDSDEAAHRMLDQLTWWARALRTHREAVPYPN